MINNDNNYAEIKVSLAILDKLALDYKLTYQSDLKLLTNNEINTGVIS